MPACKLYVSVFVLYLLVAAAESLFQRVAFLPLLLLPDLQSLFSSYVSLLFRLLLFASHLSLLKDRESRVTT